MGWAALVSTPIFGAWANLWSFVTVLPLIMLFDGLKRIYWRGLDPFIWEAGQTGRFKKMMFWNVLTHTLDWLFDAVPMAAGGYIVFKLVEGKSLPPAVVWCVFALCCYPPRLYVSQLPSPKTNTYSFMTIALPVVFVCVSLFYPLTPLVMAVACFAVLPILVVIRTYQELPNHRRDYIVSARPVKTLRYIAFRMLSTRNGEVSSFEVRRIYVFQPEAKTASASRRK